MRQQFEAQAKEIESLKAELSNVNKVVVKNYMDNFDKT